MREKGPRQEEKKESQSEGALVIFLCDDADRETMKQKNEFILRISIDSSEYASLPFSEEEGV